MKSSNFSSVFLISVICGISLYIDLTIKKNLLFIPLIISLLLCIKITEWVIPVLKVKSITQKIREEGPRGHFSKSGTPIMGGLIVIPIGLCIGILCNLNSTIIKELISISFLSLGFMFIGIIDDFKSIQLNNNKGLKAIEKLLLQFLIGCIFLFFTYSEGLINPEINLWKNHIINLGIYIWPLALFVLIAESNSSNLTDGLDGLASGCSGIIYTGFAIELILRGSPENYDLARFCIALTGAWLGFLIHNRKPAKIFMGDTGSLSIGATLAGIALISNGLWTLFIMGGIFLAESISVILQVGIFKLSKKIYGKGFRLLKMAPLHHHLELKGKKEIEVVNTFWLFSVFFVLIGLVLRSNI